MKPSDFVVLICGLPGAGKSSLIARFLLTVSNNDTRINVVTIEYDKVQHEALASSSICCSDNVNDLLLAWRQSRATSIDWLRNELRRGQDITVRDKHNNVIILDDNFYLRSMRKQVYQVCREFVSTNRELHFGIVWLDTPVHECLQRNRNRITNQTAIPDEIILRMHERFEIPSGCKHPEQNGSPNPSYFWEQCLLHLDGLHSLDDNQQRLFDFCQHYFCSDKGDSLSRVRAVVDPTVEIERLQKARAITLSTTAPDAFWRHCVTAVATNLHKSLANEANQARKYCLQNHDKIRYESSLTLDHKQLWLETFFQGNDEQVGKWLTPDEKEIIRKVMNL